MYKLASQSATARALLRRPQVEAITGLSRSTIYRLVTDGKFPAPIRLTVRSVAWPSDQIESWVNARCNALDNAERATRRDEPMGGK